MNLSLPILFLLFIIYSVLGWMMEVVVVFFSTKKLVDRGFLIGPVCPIYGVGCILIVLLLNKYFDDPLVLLVMAMLICSILEYFTGYIMEKLFKARWWDYSDKKFNINGRVCLDNLIAFGFLGLLMVYVINPFFVKILTSIPSIVIYIVAGVLLVIFMVDIVISFTVIKGFGNIASSVKKDSTEEITKKVRELLLARGGLYKRLVSAFNFEASERLLRDIGNKVMTQAEKAKNKIIMEKNKKILQAQKIKDKYEEKIKKLNALMEKEKIKRDNKLKKIK